MDTRLRKNREDYKVRIEKQMRLVTVLRSDGLKQDVHCFLRTFAEEHSGKELIIDILNSKATFIPLKDPKTDEVCFLNKNRIICNNCYMNPDLKKIKKWAKEK